MYFKEIPFGVTGVIYDGVTYIYDKESLTQCGGMYDPVFEIKSKEKYFSKCFISENVVKKIFENASSLLGNIDFNPSIIVN